MWFLIGWLIGRGGRRRWQSPEEREWRRQRGHPGAFVLVCAMVVAAAATGEWPWAIVLAAVAAWLVVA